MPHSETERTIAGRRTRTSLLDAAAQLFRQKGLAATSVQEICDVAGTTKGAFFHHFRTKHDIALAAIDRYTDNIIARLDVVVGTPEEQLAAFLNGLGQLVQSDDCHPACLIAVNVMELGAVREDFRLRCADQLARIGAQVEPLIAAAAASRGATHVDPKSLAEHLVATLQGALILSRAQNDVAPLERALAHFSLYLRRLMATPAEA